MKKFNILWSLLFGFVMLTACEKVIDVDLDEADPKLVIEAKLQEGTHEFEVQISYSAPYFENELPEYVNDAEVTLIDGNGNSVKVPFFQKGIYKLDYTALSSMFYTLEVSLDGRNYSASSFLPEKIELNEVYADEAPNNAFAEGDFNVLYRYNDPAGVENYYRVLHAVDGEFQNDGDDLIILNDNLNDGSSARIPLLQKFFNSGETVTIVLIHFDEASYDYFNSLSDIVSDANGPNAGSAAPGNPNSNWSGDVLGYFSAFSSDTLGLEIP